MAGKRPHDADPANIVGPPSSATRGSTSLEPPPAALFPMTIERYGPLEVSNIEQRAPVWKFMIDGLPSLFVQMSEEAYEPQGDRIQPVADRT
jgi:hypothetical protein